MKMIKNIFRIGAVLMALALSSSCLKDYKFNHPLGVNQDRVDLPVEAGNTPVIIYSNGDWKATLSEDVAWATLEQAEGTGIGNVIFHWDNNLGRARRVDLIITSGEEERTIKMIQAAGNTNPYMYLSSSSAAISKIQDHAVLPLSTNLTDEELSKSEVDVPDADWISNIKISNAGFEFDVEENISGADRSAHILFSNTDAVGDKISFDFTVSQSTAAPSMQLTSTVFQKTRPFFGNIVEASVKTNIAAFCVGKELLEYAVVNYVGSQDDWITSIVLDAVSSNLLVTLTSNEEKAVRSAKVQVKYVDAMDKEYSLCSFTVTQDAAKTLITIDEAISKYAGKGAITQDVYMTGVVIGDKDSKNMEVNPMTVTAGPGINFLVNDCTNYMQNEDGSRGIRLRMETKAANILPRYAWGYINLKGAEIIKETAPVRYTLQGLTGENVLGFSVGTASNVPEKKKAISELEDTDVYTYVTIPELEFTFKQGSFTNAHEGYLVKDAKLIPQGAAEIAGDGQAAAYLDCLTTPPLRDAAGNSIYGLLNALTPWRRTGTGVPQTKVDVSGIIVHTNLIRAAKDGNIGDYSIRILERDDIKNAGSRFSKTLVDWDLNKNRCASVATAMVPAFGEGTVSCSIKDATAHMKVDYNNLIGNGVSPQNKGNVSPGALGWKTKKWWDLENDKAPYFEFTFSTKGVSGTNLVFNWAACSGDAAVDKGYNAPANWHFEYSTDGVNFTRIDKEYAIRPVVWWTTCALYCCQGCMEYSTPLPSSLFGQDKVYLRLVASSKVAASLTDPEGGSVDEQEDEISIRFGEIAVEYN